MSEHPEAHLCKLISKYPNFLPLPLTGRDGHAEGLRALEVMGGLCLCHSLLGQRALSNQTVRASHCIDEKTESATGGVDRARTVSPAPSGVFSIPDSMFPRFLHSKILRRQVRSTFMPWAGAGFHVPMHASQHTPVQ